MCMYAAFIFHVPIYSLFHCPTGIYSGVSPVLLVLLVFLYYAGVPSMDWSHQTKEQT